MHALLTVAITAMENDLFKDFVRRLRENNVMDSVKNLKDMYMDFVGKYTSAFIFILQLYWHSLISTRARCFHSGWWTKVLFTLQQRWWFQCWIDDLGGCGWYGKAGKTRDMKRWWHLFTCLFFQLLCVCVALGENPLIRYHRPLDVPGTINRNIPLHLAKALQDQLDAFMEINGSFPVSMNDMAPSLMQTDHLFW